jgi:hypothetical protein
VNTFLPDIDNFTPMQIAPLASELAMSAWQPAAGAPLSSNSTAQSAEFIRMLMISKAADAAKKVMNLTVTSVVSRVYNSNYSRHLNHGNAGLQL